MRPFQLSRVPAIRFAAGALKTLGVQLRDDGFPCGPVLLVADPGLTTFGFIDTAIEALAEAGYDAVVFTDITSDPKEAQVQAAIALARQEACGAVAALGGGSALDAGKIIAALCLAEGPVARYRLAAEPLPAGRLPMVAIPTTAGTGSEATSVSILSCDDGVKYWYWSTALKPDLVILDPALTAGLPPHLTAATGLDAIVHAIEASTNRSANPAIDHYALAAIRLAKKNLPRAVSHGDDLDARGAMLLAACDAGVAIDNAGTALAHCAGHALGSLGRIHHGRAVALSMAATFPWIMKGEEERFAGVADAFGVALPDLSAAFADFVRILPIEPLTGDDPRLTPARLAAQMAALENQAMRLSTARTVGDGDLAEIAELILSFR